MMHGFSISIGSQNVTLRDEDDKRNVRLKPGASILGRYIVKEELGQGGMGIVYRCHDSIGKVDVAIKGLPPEVSHSDSEMEGILENYQLVRILRHPNIAGVTSLEQDKTTRDYYLVMDIAAGESLEQWRRRNRDAGIPMKLAILRQVAEALDYAHGVGVIHRDIKPENIMIDADGHVSVLDFGLAERIRTSLSRVSMAVTSRSGTPGYKSPEQWRAQPQGAAADMYSLGVVAYVLLSGRLPFDSSETEILRLAVLNDPVPPVCGVPSSANAALRRALAKNPEDRFKSCVEFVEALHGRGLFNNRYGKIGLIIFVLVSLGIGGMCLWMQNRDDFGKEEHKTEEVERKVKSVAEREKQQNEAEAEIDEVLAQHYDKEDEERLVKELRQVWRKQVKSIYDFAPPPYMFSAFKEISSLRRTHHDTANLAKKNKGESPIFPEERIREIVKKTEAEFVNRGSLPSDRNRHRLIQASFALAGLGCKKALAFMFENKISEPNFVFDGGYLHFAVWMGRIDMIDFLLEHGAHVNMPDADGQTPVSWAFGSEKRLATIRYLIGRGASIYNVCDEKSLLQDAARHGALDIVKYLIEELGYEPDATEYSKIMRDTFISNNIKTYLQGHGATEGASGENYFIYTVKDGEDITSISIEHNISPSKIRQLNKLPPDAQVHVGMQLKLPISNIR